MRDAMQCRPPFMGPDEDPLIVRPFRTEDHGAVMDFLARVFAELGHDFLPEGKDSDVRDLERSYLRTGGAFFVLAGHSGIEGCVGVRRFSETVAELKRLYVSAGRRGRGFGRQLCSLAVQEAEALGYRALRLDTTRGSIPALNLFRDLGFREIPRYNQDPFAGIFMEKMLTVSERG